MLNKVTFNFFDNDGFNFKTHCEYFLDKDEVRFINIVEHYKKQALLNRAAYYTFDVQPSELYIWRSDVEV